MLLWYNTKKTYKYLVTSVDESFQFHLESFLKEDYHLSKEKFVFCNVKSLENLF